MKTIPEKKGRFQPPANRVGFHHCQLLANSTGEKWSIEAYFTLIQKMRGHFPDAWFNGTTQV
jgi:hypothetical protein